MKDVRFSWDPKKNLTNVQKHGISFEEAQTVFYDENARLFSDNEHSKEEERFILLGFSQILRLLVVCHCYRQSDEEIRIFSARRATKKESKFYKGDK